MSVAFIMLVAVSVISLTSLFKQALQPQTEPSNVYIGGIVEYYVYGCLGQTITYSLMFLVTAVFIIAVFVPKTYDDYLLGWAVWQPVLTIWLLSFLWPGARFGMGLTSPEAKFPRLGRFLAGVVLVLSFGFAVLILPLTGESYEQTVQALWNEPLIQTGEVRDKYYRTSTRGGATYYMVIDEVRYYVPYRSWYDSWQEGQTITFIIAPPGMLDMMEIFPSDEVGYTWVGGVLFIVGAGGWLVTAVAVYYGMLGMIGRFWPRLHTPQPVPAEKEPIKYSKVIELAEPPNYWLLGGGLLMILLSYFYSLRRIKKR